MTDTPTPADVAEAADKLQSWLDGDGPMNVGAEETAIAALRSAPPAPGNGAAAMREAARLQGLIDCACNALTDSICVSGNDAATNLHFVGKLRRDAIPPKPLPAPEVPDQMAAFGAAAWDLLKTRYGAAEMCEGDEAFIELALKAGLCTRQPYDREQHGYVEDADEGDMIYVWGKR